MVLYFKCTLQNLNVYEIKQFAFKYLKDFYVSQYDGNSREVKYKISNNSKEFLHIYQCSLKLSGGKTMNEWEEISFDEVEGRGWFKFEYLIDGEGNGGDPWAECIENEEGFEDCAQELLLRLQNDKRLSELKAYKSIAEYE